MSRFKDINDKQSMKRFWANRFFTLGFYLVIFVTLLWAYTELFTGKAIIVPKALLEMWIWMMGFASLVLLGTVIENKIK